MSNLSSLVHSNKMCVHSRAETRCRHYMVDPTPSNKFVIVGEPKVHKTLAHLVDFHQQVGRNICVYKEF